MDAAVLDLFGTLIAAPHPIDRAHAAALAPRDGKILVHVRYAGLCGSDLPNS